MVAKAELKRLKGIKAEAAKKKQKTENAAGAQAVAAITNQPEFAHGVGHGVGALVQEWEALQKIALSVKHFLVILDYHHQCI